MNTLPAAPSAIELGVNIDHVATLRNARGTTYPDPVHAALLAEDAGADAITLHLREDRRHIREADVIAIRNQLVTRMNLECAVTSEMIEFACAVRPHDVCLVPERRAEVTTEGGLDVTAGFDRIKDAIERLAARQIRVSLFIDPSPVQIRASAHAGAPVIELHTGRYANAHEPTDRERERSRLGEAAQMARALGLKVNAGHGLHYENVEPIAALVDVAELNIGHAIVARALFSGWDAAIRDMKALMVGARLKALGLGK